MQLPASMSAGLVIAMVIHHVWERKKPKMPKWRPYPWSKDEKKLGNLGGKSASKALQILRSLRPGGGAGADAPAAGVKVSTN